MNQRRAALVTGLVGTLLLAGCATPTATEPKGEAATPIDVSGGVGQEEAVSQEPTDDIDLSEMDLAELSEYVTENLVEPESVPTSPPGELDLGFTDADIAMMRQMLDDPATDPGLRTTNQLEYDLATGVVTVDDYTRYAIYRWLYPDEVPAEYRLPPEVLEQEDLELTIPMWVAMRYWDHVQPETREELEGFFGVPPER